ncbi:methyl-accepting chemotaxis protein [Marinomonas sp. PE14-40]|uniref:methyl-accepting chemotaxis protein n=1 Tax=Marinomonas sp. PE14-40 TaxID=3060621 RepID=UPI003F6692D8
MLNALNNIQIRYKLWAIIVLMSLGTSGLIGVSLYSLYMTQFQDRQDRTKDLVEVAHSTLNHYYQDALKQGKDQGQARQQAFEVIRELRYEGKEYFWINDMNSTMLMHPITPALEGKDMSQFEDVNGVRVFAEFLKVVEKDGAGFVDYMWPKAGETDATAKNAYVKAFEPWNIIIGTGVYLDALHQQFFHNLIRFGIAVILLTLFIGGTALFIIYLVTSRVIMLKDIMLGVAESGDLTQRVDFTSTDELGVMASSYNKMMESFQQVVNKVGSSSSQLDNIVVQSNQISDKTTQGVETQLKETEQTASAMLQMAASAQQANDISAEASNKAQEVQQQSKQGLAIITSSNDSIKGLAENVAHATNSIHQLRNSVMNIETVLEVIGQVSDQTNLLALNAAIEAARAGEQGRGFAVVADEVRHLAQRSQGSAVEIQDMIESLRNQTLATVDIMEKAQTMAQEGVEQAVQAGSSFSDINHGIKEISHLNQQITLASHEQTQVAEEISRNINNINTVTEDTSQDNKAMGSNIVELKQCAGQLRNLITEFST